MLFRVDNVIQTVTKVPEILPLAFCHAAVVQNIKPAFFLTTLTLISIHIFNAKNNSFSSVFILPHCEFKLDVYSVCSVNWNERGSNPVVLF